jgi:hypothetical protein
MPTNTGPRWANAMTALIIAGAAIGMLGRLLWPR